MAELAIANKVFLGNGSRMNLLGDGQADLVVTSPPYFPNCLTAELHAPRSAQKNLRYVETEILSFARTLRPVFTEVARVLGNGRALVVQTKDIRFGDFLIPLSDAHLSVALSCGFHLVSRISWVPKWFKAKRLPSFLRTKRVGSFRSIDPEMFLILSKGSGLEKRGAIEMLRTAPEELARPLWTIPFRRRKDDHPHVSPRSVIRELILLLTEKGDLVVDPFAGFGTVVEVASSLGRIGIGWDIDENCVFEANRRIS